MVRASDSVNPDLTIAMPVTSPHVPVAIITGATARTPARKPERNSWRDAVRSCGVVMGAATIEEWKWTKPVRKCLQAQRAAYNGRLTSYWLYLRIPKCRL